MSPMRTPSRRPRSAAPIRSSLALALALAACNSSPSGPGTGAACDGSSCADAGVPLPRPDLAIPPDLLGAAHYRFIFDTILAPDSKSEATKYLYDLDASGTPKNKLVSVVDALNLSGAPPLQGTISAAVTAGTLIQLVDFVSIDPKLLYDGTATIDGYAGKLQKGQDPGTLYTGLATVDVDVSELPAAHTVPAILSKGVCDTLHLPPASANIHLPLEGVAPVPLTLHAARFHFRAVARQNGKGFDLVEGVLNGGIAQKEIHERLAPAVAAMIQKIIDADPKSTNAQSLLANFDKNKDGKVTTDEIENHPIVSRILEPDADLFDDKGNLAPNQDKTADSLSFGVGFTAVPVEFQPPK